MHDYSIGRNPKVKVLLSLTLLAVIGAPILNGYMRDFAAYLELDRASGGNAFTTISVFGVFSLLYWVFNQRCWK